MRRQAPARDDRRVQAALARGHRGEWTRFPIARLRCTHATRTRTLHWRDRNLHFHRYDQIEPSPQIDDLLREIGRDPTAIFWG